MAEERRRAFVEDLVRNQLPDYEAEWTDILTLRARDNSACLACCAPGCFQDKTWAVSMDDAAWIVCDALAGGFNRMQGNMADTGMLNDVHREMVRVQAIFSQGKAAFDSQVKDEAQAVGTVVATVEDVVATVEDVTMERAGSGSGNGGGIAAELKELAALRESGALTEEEFAKAKAKVMA